MKERVIAIVRQMLGKSQLETVPMVTEDDLSQWLEERKRYRDLNEARAEEYDERLDALAAREDKAMRERTKTLPKSLARTRCLEKIKDARDEAKGIGEVRGMRRKNVKLNRVLIIEVEKAIAADEVGLQGDAVDEMMMQFQDAMQDWRVVGDSVEMGERAPVVSEDDDLLALEKELEGTEVPDEDPTETRDEEPPLATL